MLLQYNGGRNNSSSGNQMMSQVTVQAVVPIQGAQQQNRSEVSVYIAIDTSGSMGGEKIDQVCESLRQIIDKAPHFVRFVVRSFNSEIKMLVMKKKKYLDVDRLVKDLKTGVGGNTSLYDAWGQTIEKIPISASKLDLAHIIIFTDGGDNASKTFDLMSVMKLTNEKLKNKFHFTFVQAGNYSTHVVDYVKANGKKGRCKAFNVEDSSQGIRFAFKKIQEQLAVTFEMKLTADGNGGFTAQVDASNVSRGRRGNVTSNQLSMTAQVGNGNEGNGGPFVPNIVGVQNGQLSIEDGKRGGGHRGRGGQRGRGNRGTNGNQGRPYNGSNNGNSTNGQQQGNQGFNKGRGGNSRGGNGGNGRGGNSGHGRGGNQRGGNGGGNNQNRNGGNAGINIPNQGNSNQTIAFTQSNQNQNQMASFNNLNVNNLSGNSTVIGMGANGITGNVFMANSNPTSFQRPTSLSLGIQGTDSAGRRAQMGTIMTSDGRGGSSTIVGMGTGGNIQTTQIQTGNYATQGSNRSNIVHVINPSPPRPIQRVNPGAYVTEIFDAPSTGANQNSVNRMNENSSNAKVQWEANEAIKGKGNCVIT